MCEATEEVRDKPDGFGQEVNGMKASEGINAYWPLHSNSVVARAVVAAMVSGRIYTSLRHTHRCQLVLFVPLLLKFALKFSGALIAIFPGA